MTEVRYFSRSGNTKVIAEAIAQAAGTQAKDVETPLSGRADVLFLGGALYAGGIAGKLKKFIKTTNPELAGTVAVFSTAANPDGAYAKIRKWLEQYGFRVLEREFHCLGKDAKGKDAALRAGVFAKEILG